MGWEWNGMKTNENEWQTLYYYGICDESKQTLITQNNSETEETEKTGVTTSQRVNPTKSSDTSECL